MGQEAQTYVGMRYWHPFTEAIALSNAIALIIW